MPITLSSSACCYDFGNKITLDCGPLNDDDKKLNESESL